MSKQHGLGDAPIEPQYREQMKQLAHALDDILNGGAKGNQRKVGFCLMVFSFGEAGRANYISNADRSDVVTLLREQLARFEGQPEMTGKA
jgi:hypothetical protein